MQIRYTKNNRLPQYPEMDWNLRLKKLDYITNRALIMISTQAIQFQKASFWNRLVQ